MSAPTIPDRLADLAAEAPEALAVTCGRDCVTRAELDRRSNRMARAYRDLGVGQGDYVSILLPNSIEFYVSALAVWKLGAIPQPLSSRLPREELDAILDLVPRSLVVGRERSTGAWVPAGYPAPGDLSGERFPYAVSPTWKAMASGGSTGRPKLIETTADSTIDLAATGRAFNLVDDEVQLVTGPLSHNNSFMMSLLGLALGHHLVVMPRFDAAEMLRLITEHRVSFIATVPTVLQRALIAHRADPAAYDLSSLRLIWHGAAPCPPSVKRGWIDLIGPERLWEYYGGTEMQAGTFIGGADWLEHPGSIGRVAIGQIKVIGPDGRECRPGEVGELFMRPAVEGHEAYRYVGSDREERDGWDTIGDLGHVDEDGFFYLSDRRVDMFNVGGSKVYPAEIESALAEHPAVLSCLVVGVPHPDLGQVPYALVQTTPDAGLTTEDLQGFLAERLVGYKVPRQVEFTDTPLRDDAGKARRLAVRDRVIDRLASQA